MVPTVVHYLIVEEIITLFSFDMYEKNICNFLVTNIIWALKFSYRRPNKISSPITMVHEPVSE